MAEITYCGMGSDKRWVRCYGDGRIKYRRGRPMWLDGKPDRQMVGPGGYRHY